MKLITYLLGILLIAIAVVYFFTPADLLPAFFPGHAAGATRVHMKNGVLSAVLGVVLLLIGWFMGQRRYA